MTGQLQVIIRFNTPGFSGPVLFLVCGHSDDVVFFDYRCQFTFCPWWLIVKDGFAQFGSSSHSASAWSFTLASMNLTIVSRSSCNDASGNITGSCAAGGKILTLANNLHYIRTNAVLCDVATA
ncbi:hypothetical protein KR51_00018290 [Rubidibacter lacunae KORDI 51-2]|uniref:Uncharacterized protein n=1 Tax=Rubidibacter lacunae KORDI 51-2 TaxID=582515 RepID=U5DL71_9CHRO|nr:hypothetical protein KR51_00018290 [Rubidibacter lacunae KORDI 51-2]